MADATGCTPPDAPVGRVRSLTSTPPAWRFPLIPLAASGLQVDGIDYSQRAIDLIAAHPQGSRVNASVADMSDFNTISNLTTQDGQVACFERAAVHLLPGGRFVIENGVPNLRS